MLAETSGTDAAVIASFQKSAVLPAILVWMLLSVVFLQQKIGSPLVKMVASLALSLVMLLHAAFTVELPAFIGYLCRQSTIYQENYVDPLAANITFPQQKRNLIYIYLESMENSYMDTESGGALQCNVMPELTVWQGRRRISIFPTRTALAAFRI